MKVVMCQEGIKMPIIEQHEIERALLNIESHSDTDVFPRGSELDLIYGASANKNALVEVISEIVENVNSFSKALNDSPPVNQSSIYPSGFNGYRWVTKIDPLWNAVYVSLSISLAKKAEAARISLSQEMVFSHRFNDDKNSKDLFTPGGWGKFIDRSKSKAEESKYVLIIDIADFYSRIYLHRLENEIERVSPSSGVSKMINDLISNFNSSRSFGIPIGGPASRIMSEILFNSADKFMQRHLKIDFVRYADDYRIFLDSVDEANHITAKLSQFFFENEGLSLQKHKTRIITSSEYLASIDYSNSDQGSSQHFLGVSLYFDPYNPNAEEDYETLRNALEDFDVVDLLNAELSKGKADLAVVSKIARSLHAMPAAVKVQACRTMIENTHKLYPVLPKILRAIWSATRSACESGDTKSASELIEVVRDSVLEDRYIYESEISVAFACKIVGAVSSADNEELLGRIYGLSFGAANEPSTIVQTEIMSIMAKWKVSYWILAKKPNFGALHPRVQEEFYRATYSLGDEGKHWRQHNDSRFDRYRKPFVKRV